MRRTRIACLLNVFVNLGDLQYRGYDGSRISLVCGSVVKLVSSFFLNAVSLNNSRNGNISKDSKGFFHEVKANSLNIASQYFF